MSNVLVDRDKIDVLANAISIKSGEPLTLTLDEMVEAVDGIEAGGITPTGNIDITSAGTTDVTNYATATVPQGSIAISTTGNFIKINGTKYFRFYADAGIESSNDMGTEGYISDHTIVSGYDDYSIVPSGTSVTPTESSQTVGGTNYMMQGAVTVNAIPSNYVGSGITQRSSTDLTASGATVTVPSGYYSAQASKAVASGTEGTPTATKGTVSNHAVTVTPSVTNTAGYISGGTKTGTGVSVSASELVSGSETKTANGTYDVTNLAELVVNVASGSSKNTQVVQGTTRTNASSLTAIGSELTVSTTGTYDIYYSCFRTNTSSSYTWATRLYINGTAYGTAENTTWTNNQQNTHLSNISLTDGDKLRVYGRNTRGTSYYVCCPSLVIVEA